MASQGHCQIEVLTIERCIVNNYTENSTHLSSRKNDRPHVQTNVSDILHFYDKGKNLLGARTV